MNMIEYYKEKGLPIEGLLQINMIRGCILASHLDNQDKREVLDFMTALEEYLEDEEKRFIIPLPGLVTTDGKQQYLTHKDCKFFASRRDETLIQTWKEERLKLIPEFYRQFIVEFDEEKEY